MSGFKVGDKVRRKAEFRDADWGNGDAVFRVLKVAWGCIWFSASRWWWSAEKFEPADTVEEDRLARVTAELAEAKETLALSTSFRFPNGWAAYQSALGHWVAMCPYGTLSHKSDTMDEAIAKCREGK